MNRSVIIVAALFFALIISSVVIASNYASTAVYFNVPETTTFTIAMPDTYTSPLSVTGTSEAAATSTDWISFNFTAPPAAWQQPSVLGNFSRNQTGPSVPIMLIDNTGNVNVTFSIRSNNTTSLSGASCPPACFNISYNASDDNAACHASITTAAANITATYAIIATNFNFSGTCRVNLTLWGFTASGTPGGQTTTNLLINSTKT